MFPINLLIVQIFRFSRPKPSPKKKATDSETSSVTETPVSSVEELADIRSQPSVLQRLKTLSTTFLSFVSLKSSRGSFYSGKSVGEFQSLTSFLDKFWGSDTDSETDTSRSFQSYSSKDMPVSKNKINQTNNSAFENFNSSARPGRKQADNSDPNKQTRIHYNLRKRVTILNDKTAEYEQKLHKATENTEEINETNFDSILDSLESKLACIDNLFEALFSPKMYETDIKYDSFVPTRVFEAESGGRKKDIMPDIYVTDAGNEKKENTFIPKNSRNVTEYVYVKEDKPTIRITEPEEEQLGTSDVSDEVLWEDSFKINLEEQVTSEASIAQMAKKPFQLPWWTFIIGWMLIFITVFVSGFFTLLYGLQYGKEKSQEWLVSMIISTVQDVLFLQPVKVNTRVFSYLNFYESLGNQIFWPL